MTTPKTPKPRKTTRKNKTTAPAAIHGALPHGTGAAQGFALAIHPEHMRTDVHPLVLLVDCSASMSEMHCGKTRDQHARDTLKRFDMAERPVYVLTFGDQVGRLKQIDDVRARGCMTEVCPALILALDLKPHRIILITDGYIDDATAARALILSEMVDVDGILCCADEGAQERLQYAIGPGTVTLCTPDQLADTTLMLADRA